ncbi:MAG: hypothetical protein FJX77_02795 [Armatimonadetes bacterium]|nr:hypothetical protein [Armatimonadota bacterium]
MSRERGILPETAVIRPLLVRHYALHRGWRDVTGTRDGVWIFAHRNDGRFQVMLPRQADAPDYPEALAIVARRFAEAEGRAVGGVLFDLSHADADVLSWDARLPGDARTRTLDQQVRAWGGVRSALLCAAGAVLWPSRRHPPRTPTWLDEIICSCQVASPGPGSGALRLICPLAPTVTEADPPPEVPLLRRTVCWLLTTTATLASASQEERLESFLEADRASPTVSAAFCEALLHWQPCPGAEVEFSVTWASDPAFPPPPGAPEQVRLSPECFSGIERAAALLRSAESAADRAA